MTLTRSMDFLWVWPPYSFPQTLQIDGFPMGSCSGQFPPTDPSAASHRWLPDGSPTGFPLHHREFLLYQRGFLFPGPRNIFLFWFIFNLIGLFAIFWLPNRFFCGNASKMFCQAREIFFYSGFCLIRWWVYYIYYILYTIYNILYI